MNERLLALDIGDARIGIAVSDSSRLIASPVEVLHRKGWGPDVKRICELCRQFDTTEVLSGLPLNMDGSAGFQTEKVRNFCEQLEKAGLTVYYQDERLTTVTAERALLEDNMHRADRKQHVDKVAAAIILQQYLDAARTEADDSINSVPSDDTILEFEDEDGQPLQYRLLGHTVYQGATYAILTAMDDPTPMVMLVTTDDEGDYYEPIDDQELLQAVIQTYNT